MYVYKNELLFFIPEINTLLIYKFFSESSPL